VSIGRFVASAAALFLVALLPTGVHFRSVGSVLLAALVLGLANLLVRPLLLLLTLPLNILTFGLFTLVVNALIFLLVAAVVPGMRVAGFLSALVGALLTGVLAWLIGLLLKA
jgi:putative membrane protein